MTVENLELITTCRLTTTNTRNFLGSDVDDFATQYISQVCLIFKDVVGFGVQAIGMSVDELEVPPVGGGALTGSQTLAQQPLDRFGTALALSRSAAKRPQNVLR